MYYIQTGVQVHAANFTDANKQFDCLEASLVCNKSDQHLKICDTFNVEVPADKIRKYKIENITNT